jgi:hypothetical protein
MSSSEQTLALRYALLASGAVPEQSTATINPTVAPSAGQGGYSVIGALQALVQFSLQEDGNRRRARVTLSTVGLTDTYRLDFPSASQRVDYVAAAANLTALIAGWVTAVNADADVNTIVVATVDPDDAEVMLLEWIGSATGIAPSRVGAGTGVVAVTTEYVSGVAALLERADVRCPVAVENGWNSWQTMNLPSGFDGTYSLSSGRGVRVMVPCPGRAALFPLLTNLAGHAGDVATGTGTIAYVTPKGLVAPVVSA